MCREATIDLDQGHVTYDFGVGSLPYQVKPHVYVNRSARPGLKSGHAAFYVYRICIRI